MYRNSHSHPRLRAAISSSATIIFLLGHVEQSIAFTTLPLANRLPLASARPLKHICNGPSMNIAFLSEGLQHGYHLFDFVGRRLPRQFFTELGTPERTPMWVAFFLLSNIAFPIAGVKILVSRERPNRKLAFFVFLVGVISTTFHWSQCSLGSGSPVVHTWCLVDTTISSISGLVYIIHSWGTIRKRMFALFALAVFLLFDTSKFYTITHSLWHVASAYVAYRLVKDRDVLVNAKEGAANQPGGLQFVANVISEREGS